MKEETIISKGQPACLADGTIGGDHIAAAASLRPSLEPAIVPAEPADKPLDIGLVPGAERRQAARRKLPQHVVFNPGWATGVVAEGRYPEQSE